MLCFRFFICSTARPNAKIFFGDAGEIGVCAIKEIGECGTNTSQRLEQAPGSKLNRAGYSAMRRLEEAFAIISAVPKIKVDDQDILRNSKVAHIAPNILGKENDGK